MASTQPVAKPPVVHAASYVVAEAGGNGQIYAARAMHRRLAPASVIKLLTAITAEVHADPHRTYTVSRAAAATEGTSADLRAGERYSLGSLLRVMLVRSANDSAETIARGWPGATVTWPNGRTVRYPAGRQGFLDAANRTARALHMRETHMATPSGLDAPGGFTTAFDLATLGQNMGSLPVVDKATASSRYTVRTATGSRPRSYGSTVNVVGRPGVLHGKNGCTTRAGKTTVLLVRNAGHTYVVSLMGARSEPAMYRDALRLVRWAAHHRGQNHGRLPDLLPRGAF